MVVAQVKPADHVFSVGELTREIKQTLEGRFPLLWLKGELSGVLLHRSGHLYFTLKDASAQISGVMWRSKVSGLDFRPEEGQEILAFGRVTVYEKGGKYQFTADLLQPAGIGNLYQEFERLKQKLSDEGLFDSERKRPIPEYPSRIGVVTSASGAAVRDILVTLARRAFDIDILFAPAKVQGDGAAEDVARAIKQLERRHPAPDVIIVGRGGGSIEDLWAFNEEVAVRAVAGCSIPVISGVGHETDFTLVDFAADLRAPNPTSAAEHATPSRKDMMHRVDQSRTRVIRAMDSILATLEQRIDQASGAYGLKRFPDRIREWMQQIDDDETLMQRAVERDLRLRGERIQSLSDRLKALSPREVMKRGYSLTTKDGQVVNSVKLLRPDDQVTVHFNDGEADSVIRRTTPSSEQE